MVDLPTVSPNPFFPERSAQKGSIACLMPKPKLGRAGGPKGVSPKDLMQRLGPVAMQHSASLGSAACTEGFRVRAIHTQAEPRGRRLGLKTHKERSKKIIKKLSFLILLNLTCHTSKKQVHKHSEGSSKTEKHCSTPVLRFRKKQLAWG